MHGHKGLAMAVGGVTLWLFSGAIVYYCVGNVSTVPFIEPDGTETTKTFNTWNFAQCFYFSVQTGLSIGFGLLSEQRADGTWNTASEIYSIFHILIGSSLVGGALSLFASMALTRQHHFQTRAERRLAEQSAALHADGYKGFSLNQIRDLMIQYPHYAADIIRKVEADPEKVTARIQAFKEAKTAGRLALAKEILTEATEKLEVFKHDTISINAMVEFDKYASSPSRRLFRALRDNRNFTNIMSVFSVWIAIGVIFSVAADDNDFVRGLYFAVSSLSTAGMVSVKTVDNNAHVLFCSMYALVGIPIYCACLGIFANVLVDRYMARQIEDKLHGKLSDSEIEFLGHLADKNHQEEVNLSEYTELQLLRLGMIDRDTLETVKKQFQKLDTEERGVLRKEQIFHKAHLQAADAKAGESKKNDQDAGAQAAAPALTAAAGTQVIQPAPAREQKPDFNDETTMV